MPVTMDDLAADVRRQMDALNASISDATSDERLRALVSEAFAGLSGDQEFIRKVRFGAPSAELVGTKYARLGWTIADVEFAHDLLEAAQRDGRSKRGPSEELRNTFKALSEGRYMETALVRTQGMARLEDMRRAGYFASERDYRQAVRAMDTAETGYGLQLIGAQYVSELWSGAQAQARVFSLLNQFQMTDPTAYLPVEADLPEMFFVSESTTSGASAYATSKTGSNRVQVDAKKFVMHQMWSGEMEEDSITPYIPFLRQQAMRSLAHHMDSLALNGDTTNAGTGNINLDDADPADTKHYLALDGIRHAGLVDNTANSSSIAGAITLNAFRAQRGRMLSSTYKHDWSHPSDPYDLVHVADPETCDAVGFLDEVLTVDKFGPGATILTGQQAKILGSPLISSIDMPKTEADGKVSTTAGNNTKGQIATFNRNGLVFGSRRAVMIETERIPSTDQSRIVYSLRGGLGRFTPTGAASGIEWADVLYNISL